jgi:hypothetical protein
LGLLKHELGSENRVRIPRSAPGKIAAVLMIPAKEGTPKGATIFLGDVDLQQTVNI